MDKKEKKKSTNKTMTNKKDLDVPLVKLKKQPTSLPAIWNIKCLRQHAVQKLSQRCAVLTQSTQIYISTRHRRCPDQLHLSAG